MPLRSILLMRNSRTHKLAQFLAKLLEQVQEHSCEFKFKDAIVLIDCLQNFNVNDSLTCSLGVSSLFTNIPWYETIDVMYDYVSSHRDCFHVPAAEIIMKKTVVYCTN